VGGIDRRADPHSATSLFFLCETPKTVASGGPVHWDTPCCIRSRKKMAFYQDHVPQPAGSYSPTGGLASGKPLSYAPKERPVADDPFAMSMASEQEPSRCSCRQTPCHTWLKSRLRPGFARPLAALILGCDISIVKPQPRPLERYAGDYPWRLCHETRSRAFCSS